jgi:hypothetical protein
MVGVTIGGLLGGPWGAAIGAAVTTPIGIFLETTLSPIQQTATIERYIFETIRNTISTAIGAGALDAWLKKLTKPVMTAMFSEVNRGFGKKISEAVVNQMGDAIATSFEKCVGCFAAFICGREYNQNLGSSMRFITECSLLSGTQSTRWSRTWLGSAYYPHA